MDISVKLEPVDIQSDNEFNTNAEIKEEKELLIDGETQWLPSKFDDEESEYYQEFLVEYSQDVCSQTVIKNENGLEKFTIEYQDDNQYHFDDYYVNDDCEENEGDDTNMKCYADVENNTVEEFNLDLEHYTKNHIEQVEKQDEVRKGPNDSKFLCKLDLNKWITNNYIKRGCIECNELFTYYHDWKKHVESCHKELIEDYESNFYFNNDNCGVCKICNLEFGSQFSRYVHSIKHTENAAKLEKSICKVCSFSSTKSFLIRQHIVDEHPEVVKEFTISGSITKLRCPLCPNTYKKYSHLYHHFMVKHPQEYQAKFRYSCHLCKDERFFGEELFLQHVIEKHKLNSWKKLSYRKPFDDKEYFSCEKCNTLFFKNDIFKLLKHFFTHENSYYWTCKFCCKNIDFKKSPIGHMCVEMVLYYKNRKISKDKSEQTKGISKIKNLQEFEDYIAHVCPFCNTEFDKLLKWQHHLRTFHEIDTLKGLEMKVVANDNNKLICVICRTMVANNPEQLHAHRFQHLPYKPYKCLHCSATLNTFKIAFNHALKRCKGDANKDHIKGVLVGSDDVKDLDIRSMVGIQCSVCNNKKFCNVKTVFKHIEDEHNNFEEFFLRHPDNLMTCKVCNNQYVQHDKTSCFKHLHLHFDEKIFKCLLCLRSYPAFKGCHQHLFNVHYVMDINQHSTESNVQKTSLFLNKEDKVTHVTKLPQLAKPTYKSRVLNEFAEFITYACPECNEGMTTQQIWHDHITTQHNFFEVSNLYIRDVDGSLRCPTCKMALVTSITQQQKHKLTHMPYKSFICKLCYIRCNSLGVLYQHFRRIHFAPGAFECPICPEILKTSHQRTEHLKKIHPRSEWPDTMCLICYKILATRHNLNTHMDTHNSDSNVYSCDVCGAKTSELKELNVHMDKCHKRVEIKLEQELGNDFNSKVGSQSSEAKPTDSVHQTKFLEKDYVKSKAKNSDKRKSLTKNFTTKRKKE